MVAFHWYCATPFGLMLVRVAAVVFAAHDPAGPHSTLAGVAARVVAQFTVAEDWIESVRYGYRVKAGSAAAAASPAPTASAATANAGTSHVPGRRDCGRPSARA